MGFRDIQGQGIQNLAQATESIQYSAADVGRVFNSHSRHQSSLNMPVTIPADAKEHQAQLRVAPNTRYNSLVVAAQSGFGLGEPGETQYIVGNDQQAASNLFQGTFTEASLA
jgi:hypothetical protein